jgi:hypothetical protein
MSRFAALTLLCLAATAPSQAQDAGKVEPAKPEAVLELFTSQGCSSCPAADALFVELARDRRLLVLTLPVDYWDYLGWRDTLAHAAFTHRQRAYAKSRGDGHIYTPQAVINGAVHVVGSDRGAIEQALRQGRPAGQPAALPLDVTVRETGAGFVISVSGRANASSAAIWIAPVARHRAVAIQRGENKGREVVYANVVRALTRIGDWRGEPVSIEIPASLAAHAEADSFAVLVHADGGKLGRLIGAAKAPRF